MGSLFCGNAPLKLQKRDLHLKCFIWYWTIEMDRVQTMKERPSPKDLVGAKTIKLIGPSFRRNAHYKTKTITKKLYLTLKQWNRGGFPSLFLSFIQLSSFLFEQFWKHNACITEATNNSPIQICSLERGACAVHISLKFVNCTYPINFFKENGIFRKKNSKCQTSSEKAVNMQSH